MADFDSKNEAEDGMILMRENPFDLWVPQLQITYRENKNVEFSFSERR